MSNLLDQRIEKKRKRKSNLLSARLCKMVIKLMIGTVLDQTAYLFETCEIFFMKKYFNK